ncbi:GNAT family N-acetyltransferase [Candidatus Poribacteria bacterium]|nr:GNAT family N-acetyltransferase [Candidatus Poribacteria bacterium]
MNINYSFERPLAPQDVQRLLKQTSWASNRDIPGIEKMLENSLLTLGVWDDNRLIGFARVLSDGVYRALIDDVVVDESCREKGIGTEIMKHLLARLEQVEEIFLRTGKEMVPFYEKLGFALSRGTIMDWEQRSI